MKLANYSILMCFLLFCLSCSSNLETGQPLSDEQIAFNLAEEGENDPKLLVGEWEAVKFAYTADGKKISDVINIKSASLVIPVAPAYSECEVYDQEKGINIPSERWRLYCINGSGWLCSLSGNLMKFVFCGSTKIGLPTNPHEEYDLVTAFQNAYSFVIKGNELIIYFIENGEDKVFYFYENFISIAGDKNKNLIIFKKL